MLGETISSKKCLRQLLTARSEELIRLFNFYDKGILLYAGGIYDQPAVYLEAMQIISARTYKCRAEAQAKAHK